jgi:HTH-type transcriptional regulator/antitoxin HipB
MSKNQLGQIIRYYRKKTGLSQQALAQLARVGKTAIFDIEKDKKTIQLDTLFKVLEVLNIKVTFEGPFPMSQENES